MKHQFTVTLLMPDNDGDQNVVREVLQEHLAKFCGPLVRVDVAVKEGE